MVVYRIDIFVLDYVGVYNFIMFVYKEIEWYFFFKLKKVIFILKISNKDDLEYVVWLRFYKKFVIEKYFICCIELIF